MIMKKLLIGSLQYSPIYKSHCCALGKECEKNGYQIKYLFSNEYNWMLCENIRQKTIFIGNSKDVFSAIFDGFNLKILKYIKKVILDESPDYIYMYNFHPFLNYYLAYFAEKNNITFIQHIQEPFVENKSIYGGSKQYWLGLFELFQEKLFDLTDIVVLSSKEAMRLFEKRYKKFSGKRVVIPLIYEDLGKKINISNHRRYITFIGPPVASKSPEIFLDIIDHCNDLHQNLAFLLITREKIDNPSFCKKNLEILYKDKISDDELGFYLNNSLLTVTPYKIATQSSVILTSFMYGTPVISTNVGGIPEVVRHLETGYLVDINSDIEEWLCGINFLISNISWISYNCRNYFVKEFSEENWNKYLRKLLDDFNG
jgi:glycosyltransferase involved in cell wall biosynthesis